VPFFPKNCNQFAEQIAAIARVDVDLSPMARAPRLPRLQLFAPKRDDDFLIASAKNDAAVFDAFNRDLIGLSA